MALVGFIIRIFRMKPWSSKRENQSSSNDCLMKMKSYIMPNRRINHVAMNHLFSENKACTIMCKGAVNKTIDDVTDIYMYQRKWYIMLRQFRRMKVYNKQNPII